MYNWLFAHIGEDGSFYLVIARNLMAGHGVTFDGIHQTTGVHWLWLMMLAPISFSLVLACGLYALLLLCAAFLIQAILRYPGSYLWSVAFVVLLLPRGQWLMENNLVFALMAAFYLAEIKESRWAHVAAFGLVLTRIDLLLFLLPWRRYWLVAALAAVLVSSVNVLVDGHLLSIAGYIKAGGGFNDWDSIWQNLRLTGEYYFPWLPIGVIASVAYIWLIWDECIMDRIDRILVRGFVASLALTTLYVVRDREMAGWYLAPLFLTSLLLTARFFQGPMVMVAATRTGAKACRVAAIVMVAWMVTGLHAEHWPYEDFVEPIKANTPPNARIWMEDTSGKLAIATGRRFISGDGLVNSFSYLDSIRSGRLNDYFSSGSVDYVLSSNLHCGPYPHLLSWYREVFEFPNEWALKFDLSYLTNLPIPVRTLEFPKENLVFDKCSDGRRMMLFKVKG